MMMRRPANDHIARKMADKTEEIELYMVQCIFMVME
jgi:hypothetical protein